METVSQMLGSSPDRSFTTATDVLTNCVRACLECEQACVSCADGCLASAAVATLRRCLRICLDCADACNATTRMLSRQCAPDVEMVRRQVQLLALACRACADECGRHADHEFCRLCMECCRRCEEACHSLVQTIGIPGPGARAH
jgi:hypothetical protein